MTRAPLGAVEAALAAFPALAGVTVTELDASPAGPCLVAYVTPGDVDLPALHAHARKHLPGHLVPAAIVALGAMPLTSDGVIDAASLPRPDLRGLVPYRAPETTRQAIMCEIFAEVVHMPRLGVDDDFFNLAGRSIDAMLLAGRISEATGIEISMADLFDAPTVGELDRLLDVMAGTAN